MKEKLRVGILLNGNFIPAWEYKILEKIIHSEFAEIILLIKYNSEDLQASRTSKTSGYIILKLHERIDKFMFKNKSDYSESKSSSDLLQNVPEIVIDPIEEGSYNIFKSAELGEIKSHNLDIILNFGIALLKGEILKLPRYGIWSYRIGDNRIINTVASGYWEVVKKNPVTNSVLEILREDPERSVNIFCSRESTYFYSVNVNRNKLFWRASLFVPRIMKGVYLYGDSYLNMLINKFKKDECSNSTDTFSAPAFFPALRNLINYFVVTIRQDFKKVFYSDSFNWLLLFEIKDVEDVKFNSFNSFTKLQPSKDIFWADPFVIAKNDKFYVFVEEFIYRTNKGHIAVLELDSTGNFLSSERIIDRPYHLSYPFVFEVNDNYFMIPETSQNKTIELYKCVDFPGRWEFTRNLMENISAVDATLLFHNNKWWLFACVDETESISGRSTELFLYFTEDFFSGEWESHPCNPVISDIGTARPAGKVFQRNNKMYRPSQDCSVRYGKGFNLSEITILTETEYDEVLLKKVEPDWDKQLKGAHTYNFDKNFTIIDAYSYRRRFRF
jgi:hypothetical protein